MAANNITNITPDCPVTNDILQCPLCVHQLETPVTLKQCLHTFCKECLGELPQTTQDDIIGWTCPRCGKFSSRGDIKLNDFLQKVLQAKNNDGKVPVDCKQCHGKTEVKWQCNDCRIELCSPCSVTHVNIPLLKKHRITTLDADIAGTIVIDELLFCPIHEEKLLDLNCKECEVPICVLCKIEKHDMHTTETVSTALDRIAPEIEQKSEAISQSVKHLKTKINVIRSKIEDTKTLYTKIRETVHQRMEYMITTLRQMKNEQEKILVTEEKQAVTRLEETKLELEEKVEGMEQLLNMTSVTIRLARNASLLRQLQDSLLQNVRMCSEVYNGPLFISIPCHTLVSMNEEECRVELIKTFGKLFKRDFNYKIVSDCQVLDSDYICQNISMIGYQVHQLEQLIFLENGTGYY